MGNWVILAVVVGAAVLAAVLVIGLSGGQTPLPEELLPAEIAGFDLVGNFDHVEPIFKGEEYSSLVSFAPAEGSEFTEKIERMGITTYVFKNKRSAVKAAELLLSSTYPKAEEIELDGASASSFTDEEAGQVGLIWHEGPILYEVFVTAPAGSAPEMEALKRAALVGAQAVLTLWEAR
ncbi:MAG: hypothetical protein ACE5LQ_07305 [Candidatus Bipolaricaulia bacterium]